MEVSIPLSGFRSVWLRWVFALQRRIVGFNPSLGIPLGLASALSFMSSPTPVRFNPSLGIPLGLALPAQSMGAFVGLFQSLSRDSARSGYLF